MPGDDAPAIQGTPAWVDARRNVIGSSDLPILTGSTPYRTSRLSLWAIKTRLLEPEPVEPETQELYDLGHALEPVIAERYARHPQGRPVRRRRAMVRHHSIPWAAASLDRVSAVAGERRIVELKWAPHRRWIDGPEPVPAYVQDQVQWQLLVTGWKVADVAVLQGAHVEVFEVAADEGYQADLFAIASDFRRLVVEQQRPTIDASPATTRALARLHPSAALGMLPPTLELDALAVLIRNATRAADLAEAERDRLRNVARAVLGDAAGVEGPDYKITWLNNRPSSSTRWADAYAELAGRLDVIRSLAAIDGSVDLDLASLPDPDAIRREHSETKPGARVLRATFKGDPAAWS
jgi:putative phage-type endonuclease